MLVRGPEETQVRQNPSAPAWRRAYSASAATWLSVLPALAPAMAADG